MHNWKMSGHTNHVTKSDQEEFKMAKNYNSSENCHNASDKNTSNKNASRNTSNKNSYGKNAYDKNASNKNAYDKDAKDKNSYNYGNENSQYQEKVFRTGRANARPVLGFTYDIAKHIDKNYYLSVR